METLVSLIVVYPLNRDYDHAVRRSSNLTRRPMVMPVFMRADGE